MQPTGVAGRTLDLFGEAPTPEEITAFVTEDAPTARASLEKRLADRSGMAPFTGTLPAGDIQFRVFAADPDAAKKLRVVNGPGYFILGDNQRLQIDPLMPRLSLHREVVPFLGTGPDGQNAPKVAVGAS